MPSPQRPRPGRFFPRRPRPTRRSLRSVSHSRPVRPTLAGGVERGWARERFSSESSACGHSSGGHRPHPQRRRRRALHRRSRRRRRHLRPRPTGREPRLRPLRPRSPPHRSRSSCPWRHLGRSLPWRLQPAYPARTATRPTPSTARACASPSVSACIRSRTAMLLAGGIDRCEGLCFGLILDSSFGRPS
jgi:hypothetical protein